MLKLDKIIFLDDGNEYGIEVIFKDKNSDKIVRRAFDKFCYFKDPVDLRKLLEEIIEWVEDLE